MKNNAIKIAVVLLALGVFTIAESTSVRTANACGLARQMFLTYQNLFDPILPWWIPAKDHWLGIYDEDYDYLGMEKDTPEIWEDGIRTDPDEFSFEWWYFDAHFNDGSSVVVVYFTKPMLTPEAERSPLVSIELVTPDGEMISKEYHASENDKTEFGYDNCDVVIGPNAVSGDLTTYDIYAEIEGIVVDLTMTRTVPSYRPGSGHWFYGDETEYFAWFPSVPNAKTSGTMTYNDKEVEVTGSGYHDHNWGNRNMAEIMKYWWWSRSQIGPYTVIAVDIRAKNKYGNNTWDPVFVILDGDKKIIDAADFDVEMIHTESNIEEHPDPDFNGDIAHTLIFRADKENGDYAELRMDADHLMTSGDLLEISGLTNLEKFIARLLGKDPWYTRFATNAELTFSVDGETYSGTGFSSLELMDLE